MIKEENERDSTDEGNKSDVEVVDISKVDAPILQPEKKSEAGRGDLMA